MALRRDARITMISFSLSSAARYSSSVQNDCSGLISTTITKKKGSVKDFFFFFLLRKQMKADKFNQSNKGLCVLCHNDKCPLHVPGTPQLDCAV